MKEQRYYVVTLLSQLGYSVVDRTNPNFVVIVSWLKDAETIKDLLNKKEENDIK